MKYLLEVIAFDIASCKLIEQAGGGRIELCANPAEGGTTVSYGMMKAAREAVSIPIFPIIRPRGGDFLYNEEEYTIIQQDIRLCKEIGMDGVVCGILLKDGNIDQERISKLVELAWPMEFTFHRAFDRCCEPYKALEQLIEIGCNRILTSGAADTAIDGLQNIRNWTAAVDGRITILPGAGIRSTNIGHLAIETGLTEFHSSARKVSHSAMNWNNVNMKESTDTWTVDPEEIRACLMNLKASGK